MEQIHEVASLRVRLAALRREGERIALVPTMGNLHEGHLALIDAARTLADRVVATIFVNPLQFGPGEDYAAYPRTLAADAKALSARGTDLLFAPPVLAMYPDGANLATIVSVSGLSRELCGAARPGHFDGVTTVVAKLFSLIGPDIAVFGRKDLQQLTLIKRMARDLSMPLEIRGVDTVRAPDGLALSSRNSYLSSEERSRAPLLAATLRRVADALADGSREFKTLETGAMDALMGAGFEPDYVSIRSSTDLAAPDTEADARALVVLGAARLGKTRLIDNISPEPELP